MESVLKGRESRPDLIVLDFLMARLIRWRLCREKPALYFPSTDFTALIIFASLGITYFSRGSL
jgi:hypothetical protein